MRLGLEWAVFTFNELTSSFEKFTNLDTSFADLPVSGVIAVVQVFTDTDGSPNSYVSTFGQWYVFVDALQLWTGSDLQNIAYRERIGVTMSAKVEGYWIPDPWFQKVLTAISVDSDFPNAVDRRAMSLEQQHRLDALIKAAAKTDGQRIKSLEAALASGNINSGGRV